MSQLQQLTALTRVDIIFGADGGLAAEQCMRGLAAVTQLRCLNLCVYIYGRSVASLLPLTSLSSLTKLDYTGCASNDCGEGSNDNDVSLVLRQVSSKPNVSNPTLLLGQQPSVHMLSVFTPAGTC